MSVYSFQLRGLAEGVTIRKQEEMWDLMGLGVSGSIIDQKKKNKNDGCRPEADGLSQGRKKKKKKSETSNLVWRVLSSVKGRKSHAKRNV